MNKSCPFGSVGVPEIDQKIQIAGKQQVNINLLFGNCRFEACTLYSDKDKKCVFVIMSEKLVVIADKLSKL